MTFDELMEQLQAAIMQGRDEQGHREIWLDRAKVDAAVELYVEGLKEGAT